MGKLLIIEGGDGSGKATQTALLAKHLAGDGLPVKAVSFPDYDSESSALVKMYLAGEFGSRPDAVNPYVASTFYAVDRFASFRRNWQTFYEQGGIILADRYTTSNMVHQMTKYDTKPDREAFLDWLTDFEFHKFGLPEPDMVFLLDVPLKVSEELMSTRHHKTGGQTGDIHEADRDYLRRCHEAYGELINRYGWKRIACTDQEGQMRTPEAIHAEVYAAAKSLVQL